MRRLLAGLLVCSTLALVPRPARANHEEGVIGFIILAPFEIAAAIGGTVTGIGSSSQLGRDYPGLGWGIASVVLGGLGVLAGGFGMLTFFQGELHEDSPSLAIIPGTAIAVGIWNLVVGPFVISQWAAAKRDRRDLRYQDELYEEEYEYEDDDGQWQLGPTVIKTRDGTAPGLMFQLSL